MKILLQISILTLLTFNAFSKADSLWAVKPTIHFMGFVDIFYAYDFNNPQSTRQNFLFNYNRHNDFNLNIAVLKASLKHKKYRANVAFEGGTFVVDNYSSEPPAIQGIYEANVGFSLNKKNTLWLNAGIFPSHIGFEGVISTEDWTASRSLLAENSPFFISGIELSYQINKKLDFVAIASNGWQIIKVKGKSVPTFGTQINYHPNEKFSFNWSTFFGSEDPDSSQRMRYFNDFYTQVEVSKKLSLLLGFDIGIQQISKNAKKYDTWFGPALIAKYSFSKQWSSTLRLEYFQDKQGVLISTANPNGFDTYGLSGNIDFKPNERFVVRMEARYFGSPNTVFETTSPARRDNITLMFSMSVKLKS